MSINTKFDVVTETDLFNYVIGHQHREEEMLTMLKKESPLGEYSNTQATEYFYDNINNRDEQMKLFEAYLPIFLRHRNKDKKLLTKEQKSSIKAAAGGAISLGICALVFALTKDLESAKIEGSLIIGGTASFGVLGMYLTKYLSLR